MSTDFIQWLVQVGHRAASLQRRYQSDRLGDVEDMSASFLGEYSRLEAGVCTNLAIFSTFFNVWPWILYRWKAHSISYRLISRAESIDSMCGCIDFSKDTSSEKNNRDICIRCLTYAAFCFHVLVAVWTHALVRSDFVFAPRLSPTCMCAELIAFVDIWYWRWTDHRLKWKRKDDRHHC